MRSLLQYPLRPALRRDATTRNVHIYIVAIIALALLLSPVSATTPTITTTQAYAQATAPTGIAATASPTTLPSPSAQQDDDNNGNGECKLLGPFALLIQGALGALALLSLVYKRWRERPQRPLKVWAFDASKQVVGSILLHLANLVMSIFSAGQLSAMQVTAQFQPNPCSFYLLNLAIDVSLLLIPLLLPVSKRFV